MKNSPNTHKPSKDYPFPPKLPGNSGPIGDQEPDGKSAVAHPGETRVAMIFHPHPGLPQLKLGKENPLIEALTPGN